MNGDNHPARSNSLAIWDKTSIWWCGQPRRAEKSEKTGRNFSVVRSDVASRLIARVLLSYTRLQFCSRNAVTWLKAKSFLFFFVPKTLCRCCQERSRRSVEDCLRKRSWNKERQIFGRSLSLSYNLPALCALRDKFRPIRYFFCVSLLCSASY